MLRGETDSTQTTTKTHTRNYATMKINKNYKIENCTSRDETRIGITCLNVTDGWMTATDGRMLTCIPVEMEEGDVNGNISTAAFKAARKDSHKGQTVNLKANGNIKTEEGAEFPRPDVQFPVASSKSVIEGASKNVTQYKVALDVSLLLRIAQGLGGETVTLTFAENNEPIHIQANNRKDDAFAILMPVKIA